VDVSAALSGEPATRALDIGQTHEVRIRLLHGLDDLSAADHRIGRPSSAIQELPAT
jgi:hypothetical protein